MSKPLKIVITANGEGSRMKALSPKPKHLLYYGGKRIIDHIIDAMQPFGEVHLFGRLQYVYTGLIWWECPPTESRKEQLELIRDWENVLIVDCDVIPVFEGDQGRPGIYDWQTYFDGENDDCIFYFKSDNPKYGGLEMSEDYRLSAAKERGQGHKYRASGLYFLKDVGATVDRMADPNSIAAAMIGAKMVYETAFIRVGDPEDYLTALK